MPDQPVSQYFFFGGWCFDINAAERLLTAHPRPVTEVPVLSWADQYGLSDAWKGRVPIIGGIDMIDTEYAMTTDLDKPLILATLRAEGMRPEQLLIDGCHRLYRAYREQRPHLPGHVLNAAESLTIRTSLQGG